MKIFLWVLYTILVFVLWGICSFKWAVFLLAPVVLLGLAKKNAVERLKEDSWKSHAWNLGTIALAVVPYAYAGFAFGLGWRGVFGVILLVAAVFVYVVGIFDKRMVK